jgi:small nuclear ribonucleoprotein
MTEKRPFDILNTGMGKACLVRLKDDLEIRGTLASFDVHMNVVLENAEELEDGQMKRKIGTVLLRGDTVVYISPA